MPAKNSLKTYSENGYYHIYNRGVEKRLIFLTNKDYDVFLSYLKDYLLPRNEEELRKQLKDPNLSSKERDKILKRIKLNNFNNEITLLSYCLMPNHFHFLLNQKGSNSIHKFMSSLLTRYSMYFNKKYKRVGPLFQGVYKGVLVQNSEQLLHLSRYIHKQALSSPGETLEAKQPSSYQDYLGIKDTEWINRDEILSFFSVKSPTTSYPNFVLETAETDTIKHLILE